MYHKELLDKLGVELDSQEAFVEIVRQFQLIPAGGIVDSHLHVCEHITVNNLALLNAPAPLNEDYPPERQAKILLPNGIDKAVIVQMVDPTDDGRNGAHRREAERLSNWVAEHPWIETAVVAADLIGSEDLGAELVAYGQDPNISGVRIIQTQEDQGEELLRSSQLHAGIRLLGSHNLHYEWLVREAKGQLSAFRDAVQAVGTGVLQIVDHLAKPVDIDSGKPTKEWKDTISEISQNQQIWMKLSGLSGETLGSHCLVENYFAYLDHVVECFSVDRCMFGSDWFVSALKGTYVDALALYLSWAYVRGYGVDLVNKLFRQNALNFYRHQDSPLAN